MTNAEDEWGLQNGAVYNLNAKGRWNLPDLVAQKQGAFSPSLSVVRQLTDEI